MKRSGGQYKLLDPGAALGNGLVYRPDFITPEEEELLIAFITAHQLHQSRLPEVAERPGEFQRRRHLSFGWGWDEERERFIPGPPLPKFLQRFARKIAKWLDISKERVVEALINEYKPGTGLGFHRDNEKFEHIVGISLAGWCRMRFRPLQNAKYAEKKVRKTWPSGPERSLFSPRTSMISIELEPRSAYVMQKNVRWAYQHSVAATRTLRYSITFRTLPSN